MISNDYDPDKLPDPEEELRDHVYDGIQEYDKKLPNWWLMTFYGTIVFSIGYWFYFHMTEVGQTPEQKLAQAQARAAAYAAAASGDGGYSDERLVEMSGDTALLERARPAYVTNCAACHGQEAEGGAIGPSLVDGEWDHGGSPTQIFASIRDGIPAQGMPAWGPVLGDTRSAEITAFIMSLNPPTELSSLSDDNSDGQIAGENL